MFGHQHYSDISSRRQNVRLRVSDNLVWKTGRILAKRALSDDSDEKKIA